MTPAKTCTATDDEGRCKSAPDVGELCFKHYQRMRRRKTLATVRPKALDGSVSVTFKLPADLKARAQEQAAKEGRTESRLFRSALESYLDEHEGSDRQ